MGNRSRVVQSIYWQLTGGHIDPLSHFWAHDDIHTMTISFFIALRKLRLIKKEDENELADLASIEAKKRPSSYNIWADSFTYSSSTIDIVHKAQNKVQNKSLKTDRTYNVRDNYKPLMKSKTYTKRKR